MFVLTPLCKVQCVCVKIYHLVISFTQELKPLSSLVHEDSIKVSRLNRTDLNRFFSPAHNLIRANVGYTQNTNTKTIRIFDTEYRICLCVCVCVHSPTDVGISPHCSTTSLMMRPYVLT